jgi:hypothetical protein
VKALVTFVCRTPTPTREKSNGHPRKANICALPCGSMTKVELEEELSEVRNDKQRPKSGKDYSAKVTPCRNQPNQTCNEWS